MWKQIPGHSGEYFQVVPATIQCAPADLDGGVSEEEAGDVDSRNLERLYCDLTGCEEKRIPVDYMEILTAIIVGTPPVGC